MKTREGVSIPVGLVVLEAIGLVLIALGLVKIASGTDLLPEVMRFGNYPLVFLVVGVALLVPFNVHMIRIIMTRAAATRPTSSNPPDRNF
ncbi:MAG: DUF1418 family protein [Gammaproteobacteria bacterium]|nr:DUF1418 family protein [Gammaproteobacteria bacterium]MCG3144558.1 hypothetical protein [Gammaproteobacteria bacterium]